MAVVAVAAVLGVLVVVALAAVVAAFHPNEVQCGNLEGDDFPTICVGQLVQAFFELQCFDYGSSVEAPRKIDFKPFSKKDKILVPLLN